MTASVIRPALPRDPGPERAASAVLDAWESAEVVHLSGIPARVDLRGFYNAVVEAIGRPVAIAEDARIVDRARQRTGERWMEVRFDPTLPDAYRHSANAQPLHTDGSYIPDYPNATLMYCVAAAPEGGETVFLSGRALLDVLAAENPTLLARLRSTPVPHARSGLRRTAPVLDADEAGPVLNWNYYCVDPSASTEAQTLRDDLFAFLVEPTISERLVAVRLEPGDAVLWKDRRVLHGRTAFAANAVSERFIWKCAVDVGWNADT